MDSVLTRLSEQIQKQKIEVKINDLPTFVPEEVVLDIEHDEQGNFVCVGCLFDDSSTIYCLFDISLVRKLPNLPNLKIIGHNVISDIEMLQFWGLPITEKNLFWDTMIIGHILDSSLKDYGLKAMAKRELGIEYPSYEEIVGKKTKKQKNPRLTLDQQPQDLVSKYNTLDVYSIYKLSQRQRKLINVPL